MLPEVPAECLEQQGTFGMGVGMKQMPCVYLG